MPLAGADFLDGVVFREERQGGCVLYYLIALLFALFVQRGSNNSRHENLTQNQAFQLVHRYITTLVH